ncbi:ATP-binding protein [Nonomuraea jiangxiensis]|uniref:IstB-like ATP binding protein n=1 Tax=Nonomuraea jiangxiensis TaxID=633440 RepID=A0A1G9VUF5_9ACTN|nr:ATP-binding protein [Nonomuraea jiangxiensis]SDM75621.1 IstB-like ATP binding protein [Nonomuraea jiangxiensis]
MRAANERGTGCNRWAAVHGGTGTLRRLKAADAIGRLGSKLRAYLRPQVLVLDEAGYLLLARDEANLVFQMSGRRRSRDRRYRLTRLARFCSAGSDDTGMTTTYCLIDILSLTMENLRRTAETQDGQC